MNHSPTKQPDKRRSPIIATMALVAVATGGLVHGNLSQRWGDPPDLVAAADTLKHFPEQLGDWRLVRNESMDNSVVETLQCAGYVSRAYTNAATAETVRIAVIVGPPGPTAVHTPEICYSSRTYDLERRPEVVAIDEEQGGDTFWSTEFRSKEAGGGILNVYYAWSANRVWQASNSPRFEFGGSPYLFKLQVAGTPSPFGANHDEDLCKRFLRELLRSGWRPGSDLSGDSKQVNHEVNWNVRND